VKTNVTDDTQHNTARRKIRWGDEVDGGQLSLIKEFETLLPMVDTAVNSSSSDQTPEEDDMVALFSLSSVGTLSLSLALSPPSSLSCLS
jgi:hypothetical protein